MAIDYLQQLLWSPNIEARSLKGNFMCVAFMPNFPSEKKHSIILIILPKTHSNLGLRIKLPQTHCQWIPISILYYLLMPSENRKGKK